MGRAPTATELAISMLQKLVVVLSQHYTQHKYTCRTGLDAPDLVLAFMPLYHLLWYMQTSRDALEKNIHWNVIKEKARPVLYFYSDEIFNVLLMLWSVTVTVLLCPTNMYKMINILISLMKWYILFGYPVKGPLLWLNVLSQSLFHPSSSP